MTLQTIKTRGHQGLGSTAATIDYWLSLKISTAGLFEFFLLSLWLNNYPEMRVL